MSTRQVAGLLAAAAPEVVPPRDTLRAVAPDRYTLKVSIDQECEQGLRLLKGLLSHVDPRMSWGDLVARLVRDAVARHDPRGGGHGQRRRRSAGASPSRAPKKTRAAGAAAGMAQRVNESSRRAPNRTRAAAAPAAPARRGGGDTPAPQGDTAATERQDPIAMLANAAPTLLHRGSQRPLHCRMAPAQVALHRPRRPLPRRRSRRPRHCWMAPAQAALGRARPRLLRRRSSRAAPRRMAPMPALACRSRRALPRRRSRHSPCPRTADRAAPQPGQRRTQPAILSTAPTNPRHGATFPRLSGATSGYATEDAAVIAIRSPASLHLFPSAADRPPAAGRPGRWPGAVQPRVIVLCSSPHAPRPRTGCAAGAPDVAPPSRCWRAARLRWPTARRWPGGTHFAAPRAERASSLSPHQTWP